MFALCGVRAAGDFGEKLSIAMVAAKVRTSWPRTLRATCNCKSPSPPARFEKVDPLPVLLDVLDALRRRQADPAHRLAEPASAAGKGRRPLPDAGRQGRSRPISGSGQGAAAGHRSHSRQHQRRPGGAGQVHPEAHDAKRLRGDGEALFDRLEAEGAIGRNCRQTIPGPQVGHRTDAECGQDASGVVPRIDADAGVAQESERSALPAPAAWARTKPKSRFDSTSSTC